MHRHRCLLQAFPRFARGMDRCRTFYLPSGCINRDEIPPVKNPHSRRGSLRKRAFPSTIDTTIRYNSVVSFSTSVARLHSANKPWRSPLFLKDASASEAEAWLTALIETSPEQVDENAYMIVLTTLVNDSALADTARRAERWLARWEASCERDFKTTHGKGLDVPRPPAVAYQRVLQAWAASKHEDPEIVVTRAERWLLKNLPTSHDENFSIPEASQPTTASFNAFLDACSKGRGLKNKNGKVLVVEHAQKAQAVLQYMIDHHQQRRHQCPDQDSFNFVLRAWTRCRHRMDVADRVMEVLRLMEQYQETVDGTVRPNARSYAMLLDAISIKIRLKVRKCKARRDRRGRHSNNQKPTLCKPDENGWNELQLIQKTIHYMQKRAQEQGDVSLAPNTNTYNTLLNAWANAAPIHKDAPFQAERILQHMIVSKDRQSLASQQYAAAPDEVSYRTVMRAWIQSQDMVNRCQRVKWWLSKLWKDYEFENQPEYLCPTTETYNTCLRAMVDMQQPAEAERLLTELQAKHQQYGVILRPNSQSYSLVIRAWLTLAERGSVPALEKAVANLQILADGESQSHTGLATSVDLYVGILSAIRKSVMDNPDLLDIAVEIFDDLRESHHTLDCVHYARLLEVALLALSRPEQNPTRTAFVTQIVEDCCEEGLLGKPFLKVLANGRIFHDGWTVEENIKLIEQLFPTWPLPMAWFRNVKPRDAIPHRGDFYRRQFKPSKRPDDQRFQLEDDHKTCSS